MTVETVLEVCPRCGAEKREDRRLVIQGPPFSSPSGCAHGWHAGTEPGYMRKRTLVIRDRRVG